MADTPSWRLVGDWFDVCRCRMPCFCTFAQAPDEGECNGILAWHIRKGNYGDVSLDGLNVVMLGSFEGNLWAGEAKNSAAGFFLDERADERQREGLQTIFSGQAGGWPATFATLAETDIRGLEFTPINFELADDLAGWSVEVPGKAKGSAERLTGPTNPDGAPVQVHNAPGAEVGPGQVATYAIAKEDSVDAFGFKWDWAGRSSKHFPFDWSGPDGA
jgi:hypothetical protein